MHHRWRSFVLLGFLASFVAGCAGADQAPRAHESAALPDEPPTFTARPEDEPGLVDDNWLRSFQSMTLDRLVDEAMQKNRTLRGAAARREEAEARARKAGANLSPTVDIVGGGSRSGPVQSGQAANSFDLGLKVAWEIDLWGRLANDGQAASLDAIAAQSDYRFARQSLAAQIANSWFVLNGNQQQVALDREVLSIKQQTLDIVQAQVDAGLVLGVDGNVARADLARAEERLARSEGALEEAVRSVEVLLGRYPSAELAAAGTLPQLPGPTPAGLPSELLERRPDIVAQDRKVAAAFNRTEAAKAARLPRLSITGTFGGASNSLLSVLNPSNLAWSILGNLLAPVFDGGQRKADVEIATAQQEAALQDYAQAALVAFGDVETALANEDVLRKREERLRVVVSELRSGVDTLRLRYDAGQVSYLELNQVQEQWIGARDSLLKIQVERLKQRVNLHLALGGSFVSAAS